MGHGEAIFQRYYIGLHGYCSKLPQTGQLKTTGIYSLTVLPVRRLKSRRWQGHAPSEAPGKNSFFCLLSIWWWPAILGVFWSISSSLQCLRMTSHYMPSSLCVCLSVSLRGLHIRTAAWIESPHGSSMTSFYQITSSETLFPNKFILRGSRWT